MKVELLKDIEDVGTREGADMVVGLKVSRHRGRYVPMTAGSVISVSETTGQKWIDRGIAKKIDAPEQESEMDASAA